MGYRLDGNSEHIDCLEQVGIEACNGKVFGLFLLFSSIPLQVQEVGLEVLQPALTRELDEDDWDK